VLGVDEGVVAKLGLRKGMELSAEELEQLATEEQRAKAQAAALRLLERRSRSKADLERRLKKKGYEDQIIGQTLDQLSQLGLVDDNAHAQALLDSLLKRDLGHYGLVHRLCKDGISRQLAEQVVTERLGENGEAQRGAQAIEKLRPKFKDLPAAQRRRKFYEYLYRRGFSGEVIADLLSADTDD